MLPPSRAFSTEQSFQLITLVPLLLRCELQYLEVMTLLLSEQYYIKALEAYPYDYNEVLENANYALAYNDSHAGVHCLMGKLYMYELTEYDRAQYHFEQALINDVGFLPIYDAYPILLIRVREFDRAERLLVHGFKLRGINRAMIHHHMAMILEARGHFNEAKQFLKSAKMLEQTNEGIDHLNAELERIKAKRRKQRKKVVQ